MNFTRKKKNKMYTLTPIHAYIIVKQNNETILNTIEEENQGVAIANVSWTSTVNYVSECSVELSYGTPAGKELIESIFPDVNASSPYSTIEVYLKGYSTEVSFIKEDTLVFSGIIYSYAENLSYGNVNYIIHARDSLSIFTMIPVFAPGFHASTPYNFGIETMTSAASGSGTEGILSQLLFLPTTEHEAYNVFLEILKKYTEIIDSSSPKNASKAGLGKIFERAVESFQLNNSDSNVILNEFLKIKKIGNQKMLIYPGFDNSDNMLAPMMQQLMSQFLSNPTLTFWEFMMNFLTIFGLDLISTNGKHYILNKCYLDDAIKTIPKSNIINMSAYKVPFGIPTRCVLMGYRHSSLTNVLINDFLMSYPPIEDGLLPTEENGVYAIFHQAPSYLGNFAKAQKVEKTNVSKKGTEEVQKAIKENKTKEEEKKETLIDIHNTYAKYILMTERFKNRTLNFGLQLSIDLVPGVPYFFELPNKSQKFIKENEENEENKEEKKYGAFGVITQMSHSVNAMSSNCSTSIKVEHVRFPNEVENDAFPNPLYPEFDIEDVKKEFVTKQE
jgi:hypothetical protein